MKLQTPHAVLITRISAQTNQWTPVNFKVDWTQFTITWAVSNVPQKRRDCWDSKLETKRFYVFSTFSNRNCSTLLTERLNDRPIDCPNYRRGGRLARGRYSPKFLVGVCGLNFETLTLFQYKICDFPYPISDLSQNSIPHFRSLKSVHGSNI